MSSAVRSPAEANPDLFFTLIPNLETEFFLLLKLGFILAVTKRLPTFFLRKHLPPLILLYGYFDEKGLALGFSTFHLVSEYEEIFGKFSLFDQKKRKRKIKKLKKTLYSIEITPSR